MKRILLASLALGAAQLAMVGPARAGDDEDRFKTRIVKDNDSVVFDPAKAYILVETPGAVAVTLFRIPTDEARAKDREKRAAKLVEEHADWIKDHRRWEDSIKRYKPGPNTPKPPAEPIEPTEENFAWPALELSTMVTLGPINRFSKSDEASLYLQEVPPGEYAYYGSITLGLGVCACMGTVKFDAAPGRVAALRYDFAWMDARGNLLETPDGKPPEGVDKDDAAVRLAMILSPIAPHAADPRIPADRLSAAQFHAMPTLPNWYGAEINRLQPIPGVLAYDRGNVVDLQAAPVAGAAGTPAD